MLVCARWGLAFYQIFSDEINKWIAESTAAQMQKIIREGSEEQFLELLRLLEQIAPEPPTDDAPKDPRGSVHDKY